jgi:hypothetical protein
LTQGGVVKDYAGLDCTLFSGRMSCWEFSEKNCRKKSPSGMNH